jgi:hypothetical protein
MKLSELKTRKLSEETKGKWQIGNLKGVYKNFKTNESVDAKAWMRDRSGEDDLVKWDKESATWIVDTSKESKI